ncbi:MAG: chromosome segregation protein SMC [Cyclobacteriaceae bacterium]|nr:chromosome segregation protein SMC [Cyclobacteriaceae bacterium]
MSTKEISTKNEKPKKNNKLGIIVAIMAVIIIVQFVKIYMDSIEEEELTEQITETEETLAETLTDLRDIKVELEEKIAQIEKLGGDVSELEQAKAEIEKELSNTRKRNQRTMNQLRNKVEGYEELLVAKDKEIEKLTAINKELYTENTDLKTEKNQLNKAITELNESKDQLENKVEIASHLKVENVVISALNESGKERESPFRPRHINQLKIVFNIAENNVAPIEGKEIMIQILDPQDNVIFDVSRGSGTFLFNDKEEFYTSKQEILFDNSRQQLIFMYEKGSEYETGNYKVAIYTEDYKMGNGTFEVK